MTFFIDLRADSAGGNPVADVEGIVIRSDAERNPNPPTSLEPAFIDAIQGRDVLFGTHGFHVNRADGLANLGHWTKWLDLGPNGFFVGVLWPGDSRWVPFIDYPVEGDEAIKSGDLLAEYLQAKLSGAASWSFVSHSLGARLVLQTIRGLQDSAKLRSATLLAGAIDDTCLSDEYEDAAAKMKKISVLGSRCDDVLKLAFPAGDLLAGIVTRGEPYWHGALGRFGPNPAGEPSQLWAAPILPDQWNFGHFSYINCDGPISQPPGEAGEFRPLPLIVPTGNSVPLPQGALASPQGPEFVNWRQAWAAGFASSRF